MTVPPPPGPDDGTSGSGEAAGGGEGATAVGREGAAAGGEGRAAGGEGRAAGGEGRAAGAPRRSGLRNPEAAIRGLGAGALTLEAIVLLLAIQPIRIFGGHLSGWGIGAVIALAVLALLLAGSMRRRWAWHAGSVLQVLLIAAGLLHWSLAVLGLIFGAAWVYAISVRRGILG